MTSSRHAGGVPVLPLLQWWDRALPTRRGPWTLIGDDPVTSVRRFGALDPEQGTWRSIDPAADQKLPGLAGALSEGRLAAYRIGKRAIVQYHDHYRKVLRPGAGERIVANHELLAAAGVEVAVARARLVDAGLVEQSVVAGRTLNELLGVVPDGQRHDMLDRVAAALVELHAIRPPKDLPDGIPDRPERWIGIVERCEPAAGREYRQAAKGLPPLHAVRAATIHRDLHDKNLLVESGPQPQVGVIDLDGLSAGAPEDDLGNLAVHLRFRGMQQPELERVGAEAADHLVAVYRRLSGGSLDVERLAAVERHTWFRLACLYRFRRSGRQLVPRLLGLARSGEGEDQSDFRPTELGDADRHSATAGLGCGSGNIESQPGRPGT